MKLIKIRNKLELTQTEFAGLLGVDRTSLSNYESGKTEIPRYIEKSVFAIFLLNERNKLSDGNISEPDTNFDSRDYLKSIRQSRKMSQTDLADELGISRVSLSDYETGKTEIPLYVKIALLNIFPPDDSKEVNTSEEKIAIIPLVTDEWSDTERLKIIRMDLGVSIVKMAKTLGLSEETYKSYEDGDRQLPTSVLRDFLNLGYSLNWLLTGAGSFKVYSEIVDPDQVDQLAHYFLQDDYDKLRLKFLELTNIMNETRERLIPNYKLIEENEKNKKKQAKLNKK
ncbi:MAG: helix-turn-helix domain-containing protein [Candidatus Marinimicrobia bacterium]|nr:helix-turn-helix domain-containing protein [Candidatus Neomarinimicrobiota bacterium]